VTSALQEVLAAIERAGREAGRQIVEDRRRAVRQEALLYLPRHWNRLFHTEPPASRALRIAMLRRAIGCERRFVRRYAGMDVSRLICLRGAYIAERLAAFRDRAQAREAA